MPGAEKGAPGAGVEVPGRKDSTGVIMLTVSRGYQSQKLNGFPFNPPLKG